MKDHIQQLDVRKYSESEDLLSREQGQRIFEGIRQELGKLSIGGVLVLDFRRVRYATIDCLVEILSFLDMSTQRHFQDRYPLLKLESTNSGLEDSLVMILKQKKAVISSLDEKGNWKVLGELTKAQKDALDFVRERRAATSAAVSAFFNIPINAASNRLKDLYDMRLLAREECTPISRGGRHFVYRCISVSGC